MLRSVAARRFYYRHERLLLVRMPETRSDSRSRRDDPWPPGVENHPPAAVERRPRVQTTLNVFASRRNTHPAGCCAAWGAHSFARGWKVNRCAPHGPHYIYPPTAGVCVGKRRCVWGSDASRAQLATLGFGQLWRRESFVAGWKIASGGRSTSNSNKVRRFKLLLIIHYLTITILNYLLINYYSFGIRNVS